MRRLAGAERRRGVPRGGGQPCGAESLGTSVTERRRRTKDSRADSAGFMSELKLRPPVATQAPSTALRTGSACATGPRAAEDCADGWAVVAGDAAIPHPTKKRRGSG